MSDQHNEQQVQLLRDPGIEPASEVIAAGLGDAYNAYVQFTSALDEHEIKLQWQYYNDGSAWLAKGVYERTGARGGRKEITAFWLSVWEGFFRVTFYIPEKARADALLLPLGHAVTQMIAAAKPLGKLKFFPVIFDLRSDESLDAAYTLMEFRKLL